MLNILREQKMAYIGFHSIVFIMLTLSALKWVNGAPAATPSPCHLCESKIWKDFIDCRNYAVFKSMNNRVLSGTTQKLQLRNPKIHPITLETIFYHEDVQQGDSFYKIFRKFGRTDEFLSVDDTSVNETGRLTVKGNLSISNATTFYIHYFSNGEFPFHKFEYNGDRIGVLCAIGKGNNPDYLVSHAEGGGVALQKGICDNWDSFDNAIKDDTEGLKNKLQDEKYHYQVMDVLEASAEKYLSKELRSLCCADDEICKACFENCI